MGTMSRFVRPDTRILTISNGDTLTVKKRLNAGEQRASFARMSRDRGHGVISVDPLQTGIALVTAYLLDWTLTDDDGKKIPIRNLSVDELTAVLDGLDPDDFTEIKEAIEAHEARVLVERVKEKNGRAGETPSPAISPSPSDAAGASNGSENLTQTITPS